MSPCEIDQQERAQPAPYLPGVLLDSVAEALLTASTPRSRSLMVLALVGEIHDAALWLIDGAESAEAVSLGRVLSAARAHHDQMSRPEPTPGAMREGATEVHGGTGSVFDQAAEGTVMSA